MKILEKSEFEALFREHYKALCHFAFGMTADMDQAEDLVQQAFVKMWEKRHRLDPERSLKSYLNTSVRNGAINLIRDNRKFRNSILDVDIYQDALAEMPETVSGNLMASDLAAKIRVVLKDLPEKSLEVFTLSRFEELKYKEIAERLGITVKTVEAHMTRALKILREELRDFLIVLILIFMN